MTQVEQNFKKRLEKIEQELRHAHSKLELQFHLNELRKTHLDELNIAPAFFGMVIQALATDSLMSFSRIFERGAKRSTLWQFISFVENNLAIFSKEAFAARNSGSLRYWHAERAITEQTIVEHHRKLKANEKILKNLQYRRNKKLAHADKQFSEFPEKLQHVAPLSYADLGKLAKSAFDILNSYSLAFENTYLTQRPINLFDVDRVLDILKKHQDKYKDPKDPGSA
jgi:hypothetical protein